MYHVSNGVTAMTSNDLQESLDHHCRHLYVRCLGNRARVSQDAVMSGSKSARPVRGRYFQLSSMSKLTLCHWTKCPRTKFHGKNAA